MHACMSLYLMCALSEASSISFWTGNIDKWPSRSSVRAAGTLTAEPSLQPLCKTF